MKRITFWFLSTLSVVVLLFGFDGSRSTTVTASPPPSVATPAGSSAAGPATSSPTAKAAAGSSAARTVTGSIAQTQWGPVQVALRVTGGTITKVTMLQYPSGNPRDAEINDYALPILVQETTSAQSANIDMVSGATVTSTGYLQSLQSALDQAGL